MASNVSYGSLPFREQIAFMERKLNTKTDAWTDVYGAEHDNEFMVAGANRDDLVADLRTAVEKAIVGGTLEQFRKEFAAIVQRYGWSYNGGFEWRSRVIYETNLRSSYMAGRYQQLMSMRETHPYWEYVHSDVVEEPREEHLAWNGMILRWDDPWWIYHFPINAWGCQCSVIARTEDDLKRLGKTGPDTAPPIKFIERVIGKRSPGGPRTVFVPQGIDPGFEHTPGRTREFSNVPPPRGDDPLNADISPDSLSTPSTGSPALPPPQPATPQSDSDNAIDAFLSAFQASLTQPAVVTDATGQRIAIGAEMFAAPDGNGQIAESDKLLLLAQGIQSPDEIWTQVVFSPEQQQSVVHRRYLARVTLPDASVSSVVFETGTDGWAGNIAADETLLQSLRSGVLLYRRED
ncbi:PBECR2 nuclease fold domain-containing protein [Pectobacterium polaris]|uniref:PBECR2 nuclease fold domain-containing protein n=1 Tax=Pectobacterium polaris TaxID=2042057 RepID=UPI001581EEA0|nr:PBECR2 nuclease fold domain-containing protein [Pectobacterium polaris]